MNVFAWFWLPKFGFLSMVGSEFDKFGSDFFVKFLYFSVKVVKVEFQGLLLNKSCGFVDI